MYPADSGLPLPALRNPTDARAFRVGERFCPLCGMSRLDSPADIASHQRGRLCQAVWRRALSDRGITTEWAALPHCLDETVLKRVEELARLESIRKEREKAEKEKNEGEKGSGATCRRDKHKRDRNGPRPPKGGGGAGGQTTQAAA